MNNFGSTNAAAGNADLTNIATNPYARDRSLDRGVGDYGDRNKAKDMSMNTNARAEKDVLDNFMSLPK